jgi:hypothetical protein
MVNAFDILYRDGGDLGALPLLIQAESLALPLWREP